MTSKRMFGLFYQAEVVLNDCKIVKNYFKPMIKNHPKYDGSS